MPFQIVLVGSVTTGADVDFVPGAWAAATDIWRQLVQGLTDIATHLKQVNVFEFGRGVYSKEAEHDVGDGLASLFLVPVFVNEVFGVAQGPLV